MILHFIIVISTYFLDEIKRTNIALIILQSVCFTVGSITAVYNAIRWKYRCQFSVFLIFHLHMFFWVFFRYLTCFFGMSKSVWTQHVLSFILRYFYSFLYWTSLLISNSSMSTYLLLFCLMILFFTSESTSLGVHIGLRLGDN